MYQEFHGEMQNGQRVDAWIREYFPDYSFHGIFLDVGANEPITINNSYHFEQNGWEVWCVEANPEILQELRKHRKNVLNYAVSDEDGGEIDFQVVTSSTGSVAGYSAIKIDPVVCKIFPGGIYRQHTVKTRLITLDTLIAQQIHCDKIDILSMDIEGYESKALAGFDIEKYAPVLCCIENIDPTDQRIRKYMEGNGYKLDRRVCYNEFYIKS